MNSPVEPTEIYRFVLHLAAGMQPAIDTHGTAALRLLTEPGFVQWNRLMFSAVSELRKSGQWSGLSPSLQHKLAGRLLKLAAVQVRQIHWLHRLAETVIPPSVTVLMIKGSALYGQVYTRGDFRACNDIDMMVRADEMDVLHEALTAAGAEEHRDPMHPVSSRLFYQRQYRLSENKDIRLDVHLHPAPAGFFPDLTREIWNHSTVHPEFGKSNIRVPSPVDHLIVQAANASAQAFFEPHYFVDSMRMIRCHGIQADDVVQRAKRLNASVMTRIMIQHLEFWFGIRCTEPPVKGYRAAAARVLYPVDRRDFGAFRERTRIRQMLSLSLLDRPIHGACMLLRGGAARSADWLMRMPGIRDRWHGTDSPGKEPAR
ncbi:MAG TPA: nucleotidyltransferase family protein [bacterium]|nr:nucleotidyltransferase family protein [bacterium]